LGTTLDQVIELRARIAKQEFNLPLINKTPAAARLYRVAFVTNLLKSFYLYKNIKDEQKLQIS